MVSSITAFLDSTVPELWKPEMSRELSSLARSLDEWLGDLRELPVALVVVEVWVKTETLVKPKVGDNLQVDDFFEGVTEGTKADSRLALFKPATLSSLRALETVPADQLETQDRSAICTDKYGIACGSSEAVVVMPCSHKYHRNLYCPMAASELFVPTLSLPVAARCGQSLSLGA